MSEYIMDPGARLEVGPHGRLLESLGAVGDAFKTQVTYTVTPPSAGTAQPPMTFAPPNTGYGTTPVGYPPTGYPPGVYPPGYVPPMDTGVGFLGPDTTLYLVAAAVGIAGLVVYRRRHAASSPASNPARRRRRRR